MKMEAPPCPHAFSYSGGSWPAVALSAGTETAVIFGPERVIPVQFVEMGHAGTPSKKSKSADKENAMPDVRTYDEIMRSAVPSVPTSKRYHTKSKPTRAARAQSAKKGGDSTAAAAADGRNGLAEL